MFVYKHKETIKYVKKVAYFLEIFRALFLHELDQIERFSSLHQRNFKFLLLVLTKFSF